MNLLLYRCGSNIIVSRQICHHRNTVLIKDTLEDVSLGQLGRLYIKTVSLSKLLLTEARRSLEGQNALPRTEQSFVFHIVEWKVLDSYNSACSAPYLQTKGK